jgi:hypothetical protein
VSDPAPINAVDISGYILLGTKRLNIHITLEDTDATGEIEAADRDRGDAEFADEEDAEYDEDAEFADEEDAESDTEGDAEFDEEDEEDDAEFDEEDEEDDAEFDEEDDTEDVDQDGRAPAQASLRDLLRPRPRRPEPDAGARRSATARR